MILGSFQFSLKTLSQDTLTRTTSYNWANSDRVGGLPFVQNLGMSSDQIEIAGVFYPKLNANSQGSSSGYSSIDDIKNSDLCSKENNLINDKGEILGKFVIVSIAETQSFFDKNGMPQKTEFTLSLKRVPDEKASFVSGSTSTIESALTDLSRSYLKW